MKKRSLIIILILTLIAYTSISLNEKVYGYSQDVENAGNIKLENISNKNFFMLGEDAKIKIKLTNNGSINANLNFMIGAFDNKNKLLKSINMNKSINAGESSIISGNIKIPKENAIKIKAFYWKKDIYDIGDVIEFQVENEKSNEILSSKTLNQTTIAIECKNPNINNFKKEDFKILNGSSDISIKSIKTNKEEILLNLYNPIKKGENIFLKYKNSKNIKVDNNLKNITIMAYFDGDNNLEQNMLNNIEEIKKGLKNSPNINVIALVDRIDGYSNDSKILGENFTDTRLYEIQENKAIRLDGKEQMPNIKLNSNYEANMGNANTLREFIDFCKTNYSADSYVLIPFNHGEGTRGFCIDDTDNDILSLAEVSDNLTKKQSVDMLIYEACFMGNLETAYQYRPNNNGFEAKHMIASSATMLSSGFNYEKIFNKLSTTYDPSILTMKELGLIFVEEHKEYTKNKRDQSLAYYDLSKVENVKANVDELSKLLVKEDKKDLINKLRGNLETSGNIIPYFNNEDEYVYSDKEGWILYPYFDLYDLCEKLIASNECSNEINITCENIKKALHEFIIYSFGQSKYKANGFKDNINGVSIFFPDGDNTWKNQKWYSSEYIYGGDYGALNWCKDGIDLRTNNVGNWFEMLDSWFDNKNDDSGGTNFHQW
ncbi:clostripain-related cysteine peptidase [Clostridium senegalense]